MDNIKSENAKEELRIENQVRRVLEDIYGINGYTVKDVVYGRHIYKKAESDARDRAVRAFCFGNCGEYECELRSTCHPFNEFKQAYDNE